MYFSLSFNLQTPRVYLSVAVFHGYAARIAFFLSRNLKRMLDKFGNKLFFVTLMIQKVWFPKLQLLDIILDPNQQPLHQSVNQYLSHLHFTISTQSLNIYHTSKPLNFPVLTPLELSSFVRE
jgi:hypothetical protein